MPADRRNMRASDADRQRVSDALAQAYADGRLTLQEHTDRMGVAWAAKTVGELEPLTADLGPVGAMPAPTASGSPVRAPIGDVPPLRLVQIFSGARREGDWAVPGQITSLVLFGGSHLDMRQAAFTELNVEIQVACAFGAIDIFVPAGVTVVDETVAIFGGVDMKGMSPPVPGAPVIHLRGFVLFGGVNVRGGDYKTLGQRLGFRGGPGNRNQMRPASGCGPRARARGFTAATTRGARPC
jgi:hypothetical protein